MKLWEQGDLTELLNEGRAIQSRFSIHHCEEKEQQVAHSFAKMMFQGKTQAALQLLTDRDKGGIDNVVTDHSTVVTDHSTVVTDHSTVRIS